MLTKASTLSVSTVNFTWQFERCQSQIAMQKLFTGVHVVKL